MSLSNCCHALQRPEHRSCNLCGCYLHPQGNVRGLKTQRYIDSDLIDSPTFLQALKQRAQNFVIMQPIKLNPLVSQVLEESVAKFKLSLMTYCRAVYLFHQLLREKPQCQYQQLRYGTVCLYLTAKATECLSRIPNLQQFAKQAFRVFSQSEYDSLEEEVFNFALEKTFQVGLFTEYLEYYQVKGCLMSNQRCSEDVKTLEDRIYKSSMNYIRTGQFLNYAPEKLAACILHQSRQVAKVPEVWSQHIEAYTHISTLEIFNIMKECRKKIISDVSDLSHRILVRPSNVSSVPSGTRHIRLASTSTTGTLNRSSSATNSHFLQPLRGISVIV